MKLRYYKYPFHLPIIIPNLVQCPNETMGTQFNYLSTKFKVQMVEILFHSRKEHEFSA